MPATKASPPTLISADEIAEILGLKRQTILGWVKEPPPGFPPAFLLTPRTIRWDKAEFLTWLRARRWVDHAAQAESASGREGGVA
jgi:predicted DNA-binding transcriptional regulator AlpA